MPARGIAAATIDQRGITVALEMDSTNHKSTAQGQVEPPAVAGLLHSLPPPVYSLANAAVSCPPRRRSPSASAHRDASLGRDCAEESAAAVAACPPRLRSRPASTTRTAAASQCSRPARCRRPGSDRCRGRMCRRGPSAADGSASVNENKGIGHARALPPWRGRVRIGWVFLGSGTGWVGPKPGLNQD
jgi:hypothetical protein